MSFPASPTINQTTTTNGITYVYNTSSNNVGYWTRVPTTLTLSTATGSATRSTTTSTPPAGALVGDIWYYQGTDAVYRYEFDGFTTTWIDFNGPTIILTTGSSYSFVSGSGSSGTATTFTTLAGVAPSTANVGDQWYDSTTDTLYRYTYDGTNRYWVDITGASGFSGGTVLGAVTVANTLTVTGNTIIGTGGTSTASVSLVINATDAVALPVGTTAQRPANPQVGMIRYNTSGTLGLEVFVASSTSSYIGTWTSIVTPIYTVNYLIVGGGGGGGVGVQNTTNGGGGGAGGLLTGSTTVISGQQYSVIVGAGGASASQGQNSSINFTPNITALGGGYGGNATPVGSSSGGSGGGGASGGAPYSTSGSVGTPGQGNSGGNGTSTGPSGFGGGGGGGASGSGGAGGPATGGAGGTGTVSAIYSGTNIYYAGGGAGGVSNPGVAGTGGLGGGGAGAVGSPALAVGGNGVAYTGGGGGGGASGGAPNGNGAGGQGGAGVVIISYANANQRASGGVVTSYQSGSTLMWVHTFTATSGVFTA